MWHPAGEWMMLQEEIRLDFPFLKTQKRIIRFCKYLALLLKKTAFVSSVDLAGWCVKRWIAPTRNPCDWLLLQSHILFIRILTGFCAPWTVYTFCYYPSGTLRTPMILRAWNAPILHGFMKSKRTHHTRTEWAWTLAFNFLSWSSTFQFRMREGHQSECWACFNIWISFFFFLKAECLRVFLTMVS